MSIIIWFLIRFCYTHKSAPCSTHIREASFCRKWESMQRPTTGQCAESEDFERNSSTEKGKWANGSTPNQEAPVIDACWERQSVTGLSTIFQGRPHAQIWLTQTTKYVLCGIFVLLSLLFHFLFYWFLVWFELIFVSCFCFERERRERENIKLSQLGSREDLGRVRGGENHEQDILYD